MRRPAPLPSTPADRPAVTPAPADVGPWPVSDAQDAPVVPLPAAQAPDPEVGAPEESTVVDDITPAGENEIAVPIGSREVWKAARARRRALRTEIRRFTRGMRRRRMLWLSGIGAVLVLVAGCVAAAYSPLFAVERITVAGTSALDPVAVETALAGQLGVPLALVDDGAIKEALAAFPLIETYALEASPPHDLTVRVVERTPVGVVASDAGFTLIDAAGVALATTPGRPDGQPLLEIDGGIDSAAFASAAEVVRSVPAGIRDQLVSVAATTGDDVTVRLASGATVLWGSAEQSPYKAVVLEATMAAHPEAGRYDVSAPDAVVVG